jgi:hypothetical protein
MTTTKDAAVTVPEIGRLIVKLNDTLSDYVWAEQEALKTSHALAAAQLSWGHFQQDCSKRYLAYPMDAGDVETLRRLEGECARLSEQVGRVRLYAAEAFNSLAGQTGRLLWLWREWEKQSTKEGSK